MKYFITGIDTDIGKTFITKYLAAAFYRTGKITGVYKPLQSGAIHTDRDVLAPDIEAVKAVSPKINVKYSYLLDGEVSPALAAKISGIKIDINKIKTDFIEFSKQNDVTLVEGAGGLLAPAADNMLFADLIKELNIPIIIVTVPFLGRINHTLLTIHYAKMNNINIKGLIINKIPYVTNDLAIKNFKNELHIYTNVPILAEIKDYGSQCCNIEEEFLKITKML